MRYRTFGKTKIDLSILGLGCMRLPEAVKSKKRKLRNNYYDNIIFFEEQGPVWISRPVQ
jgi:predicted aldo/keto reductase-like oxidoreductase